MLNSFFNYKNRITGEVISETEFWYGALLGKIHAEDFEIILPDFKQESDPKQAAKSEQRKPLYVNRFTGEVMTFDEATTYVGERDYLFKKVFVSESDAEDVSASDLYLNRITRDVGTFDEFYDSNMTDENFFVLLDNLIPVENLPGNYVNLKQALFDHEDIGIAIASCVYSKLTSGYLWLLNSQFHYGNILYDLCTNNLNDARQYLEDEGYTFRKKINCDCGKTYNGIEIRGLIRKLNNACDLMRDYNLI